MHIFFICVEAIRMGAPYVFPSIPPLLGATMFWTGVAGLVFYPTWQLVGRKVTRMEPWHLMLVSAIGAWVFATVTLIGVIWHLRSEKSFLTFRDAPAKPAAVPNWAPPQSKADLEKKAREAFLTRRQRLELPLVGASGTAVTLTFDETHKQAVEISHADNTSRVPVSKSGGDSVWIYNRDPSIKTLCVTKSGERGKPVDIRQLRPVQRDESMMIGHHAFIEATDGRVIQLLLVGVLDYRHDGKDEARFKYQVYEPGEFLIEAL